MQNADFGFSIRNPKIGNPKFVIGGVAQLAEHRVCNAGVRGSNPLTSTSLAIANLRDRISESVET